MKIRQLCLVMLAATTMWSCAKDDVVKNENGLMGDGPKAMSFKISTPGTKSITNLGEQTSGDTENKAAIEVNSITIKIHGTFAGNETGIKTFVSDTEGIATEKLAKHTFFDIKTISKIEAFVNYTGAGAESHIMEHNVTSLDQTKKGTAVSCWGELAGGDLTQDPAEKTIPKGTTTYDRYEGTITVYPAVARIEASGITLRKNNNNAPSYSSIKFSGVFLNNVSKGGNISTKIANGEYDNYDYTATNSNASAEGFFNAGFGFNLSYIHPNKPQLVNEGKTDYENTLFPETTNACYAFNFFTGEADPKLVIAFEECDLPAGAFPACQVKQFAIVKSYKVGDTPIKLAPGNIYRITNLELLDENVGEPGSSNLKAVIATVSVTPWNIIDTSVEWEN
ncbi:MAG: hypothetical protein ACRDDZ_07755 [Marinifilaceae bacterium]